jgi:hypothetical protein
MFVVSPGDVVKTTAYSNYPASNIQVNAGQTAYFIPAKAATPPQVNEDYSTNEELTGQKWIDNKPIYRRTFQRTFTEKGSVQDVLDDNNVTDTIVDFKVVFKNSANTWTVNGAVYYADATPLVPSPDNNESMAYIMQVTSNTQDVSLWRNIIKDAYLDGTYTITAWYTKTTD